MKATVNRIRFLEIGLLGSGLGAYAGQWGTYTEDHTWEFETPQTLAAVIAAIAACAAKDQPLHKCSFSSGGSAKPMKRHHAALHSTPDRELDIPEDVFDGVCAYVIRIQDITHQSASAAQIYFHGTPFYTVPLNSNTGENFIYATTRLPDSVDKSRWAYFLCDLGALSRSALAGRLRAHSIKHMRLPFTFSVYQPGIDCAPWAAAKTPRLLTGVSGIKSHGGAHPSALSFLEVGI